MCVDFLVIRYCLVNYGIDQVKGTIVRDHHIKVLQEVVHILLSDLRVSANHGHAQHDRPALLVDRILHPILHERIRHFRVVESVPNEDHVGDPASSVEGPPLTLAGSLRGEQLVDPGLHLNIELDRYLLLVHRMDNRVDKLRDDVSILRSRPDDVIRNKGKRVFEAVNVFDVRFLADHLCDDRRDARAEDGERDALSGGRLQQGRGTPAEHAAAWAAAHSELHNLADELPGDAGVDYVFVGFYPPLVHGLVLEVLGGINVALHGVVLVEELDGTDPELVGDEGGLLEEAVGAVYAPGEGPVKVADDDKGLGPAVDDAVHLGVVLSPLEDGAFDGGGFRVCLGFHFFGL